LPLVCREDVVVVVALVADVAVVEVWEVPVVVAPLVVLAEAVAAAVKFFTP
jgi:hypothetical protein